MELFNQSRQRNSFSSILDIQRNRQIRGTDNRSNSGPRILGAYSNLGVGNPDADSCQLEEKTLDAVRLFPFLLSCLYISPSSCARSARYLLLTFGGVLVFATAWVSLYFPAQPTCRVDWWNYLGPFDGVVVMPWALCILAFSSILTVIAASFSEFNRRKVMSAR
jgi:hypothetical protein